MFVLCKADVHERSFETSVSQSPINFFFMLFFRIKGLSIRKTKKKKKEKNILKASILVLD